MHNSIMRLLPLLYYYLVLERKSCCFFTQKHALLRLGDKNLTENPLSLQFYEFILHTRKKTRHLLKYMLIFRGYSW